jgi:hypothetical protein
MPAAWPPLSATPPAAAALCAAAPPTRPHPSVMRLCCTATCVPSGEARLHASAPVVAFAHPPTPSCKQCQQPSPRLYYVLSSHVQYRHVSPGQHPHLMLLRRATCVGSKRLCGGGWRGSACGDARGALPLCHQRCVGAGPPPSWRAQQTPCWQPSTPATLSWTTCLLSWTAH